MSSSQLKKNTAKNIKNSSPDRKRQRVRLLDESNNKAFVGRGDGDDFDDPFGQGGGGVLQYHGVGEDATHLEQIGGNFNLLSVEKKKEKEII